MTHQNLRKSKFSYVRQDPTIMLTETQVGAAAQQTTQNSSIESDRERLHHIYAEAPIVLYELTTDGRIASLSAAFESITGWPVSAWLGRPFLDLIAPEDRDLVRREFARACRGETRNYRRMHLLAANGDTLIVEVQGLKPAARGEIGVYGFLRDITELVQTEEQLRLQLSLLASISDAIIVTNLAFYVTEWNQAAERIYGWKRAEVIGRPLLGFFRTEYVDTTQEAVLEQFLANGQWCGEVIQHHKSGARLHILTAVNALYDASKRRIGAVAVNRDITAEVNARQALTEMERTYRQAILNAGGVPYQRDYSGPGYAFLGEGIEQLTGYRADELTGPLFTSRLRQVEPYGEHADLPHEERIRRAREGGGIVWREDYLFERKDGSLVWLADYAVPVLDAAGKATGALGILMDITERKRVEEERRRLQEQMAQIERLESIGQLAGGVAHDFNNMLAVILMRTEMALMQLDPYSPLRHHLLEIHKTAQRSAELVRQLLGFAQRQPIAPRPLDLNAMVEEALPMVRQLLNEEIELIWQPASNLGAVFMDPTQVQQILVNLCTNARDAISGTGQILIATENITLDNAYADAHADVSPGAYSMLTISDTGCGMTSDVLAHIFEPFFTTKEVGRGTGLGLATVYGIVQQNHGHIAVYSAPGVGATIQVFFPHHQAATPTAVHTHTLEDAPRGNHETILIVEDNDAVLEMIAEGLRHLGYNVLTTTTPTAALRQVEQAADAIDLVLTDVILSEGNGPSLARQISAVRSDLPVLYMSGHPTHLLRQRGLLPERVHMLRKPFTLRELATAVRDALTPPCPGKVNALSSVHTP